ncbi:MAG: hypothetical protein QOF58_3371 [Pseudonocardiales bacterium]|nr:hypothetical protein [Pseudonocardiales bacterium]
MLTAEQQPADAPPPPPRRTNTAVLVLAIVAGLLFVSTGALGTLFYVAMKNSVGQAKEIQAKGREIAELREKARASETEAAAARNERETFRFTAERAEKCRAAAEAYKKASFTDDQPKRQSAWNEIYRNS